ncbi:SDR family NAD(P)-dependent oxidoreductase [Dermatobacter hominis]|uniref:SDR family NAD(P)-dependent oxidoreductase n=1 Tax=Dermatobacter hominis TaxID=2884263 RepID=UPI001D0F6FA9|nr:SDR family NAD(P)-dependent oxidoreductase [Dermatobacter hominis]UDY35048.1 SDR family NAD(P)-dependent oxidoreductase [Dermatobacter hominis]
MHVDGANVLVTGASSGIGEALALELAARGATVALAARRRERLDAVLGRCLDRAPGSTRYVVDLADPEAAEALVASAWDDLGHLDVVVNNAGAPMRRSVRDLTTAELQRTMAVNFESPARICLAALGPMLDRGRGSIVNVSSFGGRAGIPGEAAYCASKFALAGWTESLALDLWDSGVEVRLVLPGAVDTEIWDQPGNDEPDYDGDLAPAGEVAAGIVAAIEGDRFEHYLPDLSDVARFKADAIEDYLAGVVAFARSRGADREVRPPP